VPGHTNQKTICSQPFQRSTPYTRYFACKNTFNWMKNPIFVLVNSMQKNKQQEQ